MACVSAVPFDQIDPDVQKVMQTYDKEIGGSAFLQAFAQLLRCSNFSSTITSRSSLRRAAVST